MTTLQLRQIQVPEGKTVEIQDVSWSEFEQILADLGDSRNTRIAYSDGTLSIMAPMPKHEKSKVCIGDFVKILLDELEMDYVSYGSTTFKNAAMSKAVEPDDCFYLKYADRMASKRRIDLSVDPPPELAIEVDVTSKTQLDAYKGLGIAELWRFDSGELRIDLLQSGSFVEVQESSFFPGWPIKEMLYQYLEAARTTNQRKVKKRFRQQVAERIAALS